MRLQHAYKSAETPAEITGTEICKPGLTWLQRQQHKLHQKLPDSTRGDAQFQLKSLRC